MVLAVLSNIRGTGWSSDKNLSARLRMARTWASDNFSNFMRMWSSFTMVKISATDNSFHGSEAKLVNSITRLFSALLLASARLLEGSRSTSDISISASSSQKSLVSCSRLICLAMISSCRGVILFTLEAKTDEAFCTICSISVTVSVRGSNLPPITSCINLALESSSVTKRCTKSGMISSIPMSMSLSAVAIRLVAAAAPFDTRSVTPDCSTTSSTLSSSF
mmetsp:Transcript_69693/g.116141  ORF Transcript_69693/g.116141 Transcript_69693/m.116141 type:complete len:221 (-) Transcript_69693:1252-1914(-)